MPKKLSEIKAQLKKIDKKTMEVVGWMKANTEDTKNKILNVLEKNPDKVYTAAELSNEVFGEKKCNLEKEEGHCDKCHGAVPIDHIFECDRCRHVNLVMGVLNMMAQYQKIVTYEYDNEIWIGIAPPQPKE